MIIKNNLIIVKYHHKIKIKTKIINNKMKIFNINVFFYNNI